MINRLINYLLRLTNNKIVLNIFYFIEWNFGFLILRYNFKKRVGYSINLRSPKSFNEKINWKKLYDKNPLIPIVSDKIKVRSYIIRILGDKKSSEVLIPLLSVYESIESIDLNSLPSSFVLKANHGTGKNLIVRDKVMITKSFISNYCKNWFKDSYSEFYKHEKWGYQCNEKKIIVEKHLQDDDGNDPKDYKFHVFHGKCEMIECFYDRFKNGKRSLFDRNWQLLDVMWQPSKWIYGGYVQKPLNLVKMIKIAEKLAMEFDYIRVDLYNLNGKIYFGEMTNFPSSGAGKFEPQSFDFELGEKWNLKKEYWKR